MIAETGIDSAHRRWIFGAFLRLSIGILCGADTARVTRAGDAIENSIGMKMVLIEAGSFSMGGANPRPDGWDEQPVHQVRISRAFSISATEVTIERYRRFRPEFTGSRVAEPAVTGLSWHDAVAFCRWLSKKEGRPYRLPTEAEWEYAARAGTDTPFWSGAKPPAHGAANPWGLRQVHSGPAEWCHDWYGPYTYEDQTDPVGPDHGVARVIRGGGLDRREPYYARSRNRASYAPAFAIMGGAKTVPGHAVPGHHGIGFRVVQGPLPATPPSPLPRPFCQQCVVQQQPRFSQGPRGPWFRRRALLPIPPDDVPRTETIAAGLHPAMAGHNHSPALGVCPNGDLLAIFFTAPTGKGGENQPEVMLIASRLRFGAETWDMPEYFLDFADVNTVSPCLYTEKAMMFCFWGNTFYDQAYPFQWQTSVDSGTTWSPVRFPQISGGVGPHTNQPITTVFRGTDGTLFVPTDGKGATSVLWASTDDGQTWYDTKGRTHGRHTAFALLRDGRILGMGGKKSDIDGYMPKSISRDGGKTWQIGKTPFSRLGGGQRPTLLRLASGRLFFAGDFQDRDGNQPEGVRQRGAYVALSDDEGETWTIRKLPGTLPRESHATGQPGLETIGYAVARQAANGVIHLLTSKNQPSLHFELNEAWILAPNTPVTEVERPQVQNVQEYRQTYASGALQAVWHGGVGPHGEYLLEADQTWFYENGRKQWQVHYESGRKTGRETFWNRAGGKVWSCRHAADGAMVRTQYWPNGRKKSECGWRNFKAAGRARRWDPAGNLVSDVNFTAGRVQ